MYSSSESSALSPLVSGVKPVLVKLAAAFPVVFGTRDLFAHASQSTGIDIAGIALLLLLFCQLRLVSFLQELELIQVATGRILGVLESDDVGASELLVVNQVAPRFGLDVHAIDRIPSEDVGIRAMTNSDYMCVVGEDLVCDWVDQVAFSIAQSSTKGVRF
ncbi:hypothetical protein HG531_003196 [Fusarium graminearum]|nr:hypothetical protein HG531_003196 [Fusarium graminearum]